MDFAWDAFLVRYRPLAKHLARAWTGKSSEAEDVVQEATLALLRAVRSGEERFASTAHARNYYLRSVRNLAHSTHRRPAPEPLTNVQDELRAGECDPLALAAVRERQAILEGLVRSLEGFDAELVARRFLRGETLACIADATGLPISTLHSRERALLARLREEFERLDRDTSA